jgi:hypothetical protein
MTKRDPHPDNALIDRMQEGGATPGHQDRSGDGAINTRLGTRAELDNALSEEEGATGVTGSDKPAQDRLKGEKTMAEIQRQRDAS